MNPNFELIDSSEFYGSPENDWKHKKHLLRKYLKDFIDPGNIKLIAIIALWCIGVKVSYLYNLHGIYIVISGFTMIFANLGTRKEGTMSAYSIFNKGYSAILGTLTSDDIDGMYVKRSKNQSDKKEDILQQDHQEQLDKSIFDGLSDEQMMSKVNKLGNRQCFCFSGRKYKKCHFYIQQREKYEREEWDEKERIRKKNLREKIN